MMDCPTRAGVRRAWTDERKSRARGLVNRCANRQEICRVEPELDGIVWRLDGYGECLPIGGVGDMMTWAFFWR
jgi:hypothetical protein